LGYILIDYPKVGVIVLLEKILLSLLILTPISLHSQSSPFAPGIPWRVIEAGQTSLIYPAPQEEVAQELARKNLLLEDHLGKTLNSSLAFNWPIILNPDSLITNGYVTVAPFRSEWYGLPMLEGDQTLPWYDLLAIHEGRHMYQIEGARRGLGAMAYLLYGQIGLGALGVINFPRWATEGDAVVTETLFSQSGRGRSPSFEMSQRAILLEGEPYSYDKAYLGSFEDYLPDHYTLGYFISTKMRRSYGTDNFQKLIKATPWLPFLTYSMDVASFFTINRTPADLYQESMAELTRLYREIDSTRNPLQGESLTPPPPLWTSYSHTVPAGDFLYSLKYTYGRTRDLIRIGPDQEEEILESPFTGEGTLDVYLEEGNPLVLTTISSTDPFYDKKSYSDILLIDLTTGEKEPITTKGRYFYPRFLGKTKRIIALYWEVYGSFQYHILNEHGEVLEVLDNPDNQTLFAPVPHPDGDKVAFIRQKGGRRQMVLRNLSNGSERILRESPTEGFRQLAWKGEDLLYSSPYSGIDNIYQIQVETGEVRQLTDQRLGAFYPRSQGENLIFSNYRDTKGYQLIKSPFPPGQPLDEVNLVRTEYFAPLLETETKPNLNQLPESKPFPSRKFSSWKTGIIPHSWGIVPGIHTSEDLGFQITGADVLQNYNWALGSFLDPQNQGWGTALDFTLQSTPVNLRSHSYQWERTYLDEKWTEWGTQVSLQLPLYLSRGSTSIQGSLELIGGGRSIPDAPYSNSLYWGSLLNWYHQKAAGFRRLYPRKGFSLAGGFLIDSPRYEEDRRVVFGQGTLYLPFLLPDASLRLSGGGESHIYTDRPLQNFLEKPYGDAYGVTPEERFQFRAQIDTPLGHPDVNLLGALYFKRLSGGLFTQVHNSGAPWGRNQITAGGEIRLWFIPVRILEGLLDMGIRGGYNFTQKAPFTEILLLNLSL